MEDNDSRKERFQGPQFEDPRENALYKRFLSVSTVPLFVNRLHPKAI
jgi:hypothetical protein